jgi:hypothetical protein
MASLCADVSIEQNVDDPDPPGNGGGGGGGGGESDFPVIPALVVGAGVVALGLGAGGEN